MIEKLLRNFRFHNNQENKDSGPPIKTERRPHREDLCEVCIEREHPCWERKPKMTTKRLLPSKT